MKNKNPNNSNNQVVYISGSISHNPNAEQDFNSAEEKMRELGFVKIYNPVAQDKIQGYVTADCKEGGSSRAAVLKNDCCWICDHLPVMYILTSYKRSSGSLMEIALGKSLGLKVIYQRNKQE
jgi:hypothetical protein